MVALLLPHRARPLLLLLLPPPPPRQVPQLPPYRVLARICKVGIMRLSILKEQRSKIVCLHHAAIFKILLMPIKLDGFEWTSKHATTMKSPARITSMFRLSLAHIHIVSKLRIFATVRGNGVKRVDCSHCISTHVFCERLFFSRL